MTDADQWNTSRNLKLAKYQVTLARPMLTSFSLKMILFLFTDDAESIRNQDRNQNFRYNVYRKRSLDDER